LSKTAKTVHIVADFVGARFSWINEDQEMLYFEMFSQDSRGELQTARILSSMEDTVSYTIREYEPVPQKFALRISDKHGNETDYIYPEGGTISPLFEQKLDKTLMKISILDNDIRYNQWEGKEEYFIDDDLTTFSHAYYNVMPGASFTIALGKKAKLSRLKWYQRSDDNRYYNSLNIKVFEVYVCYTEPSKSGDWSEWTKVMYCDVIKPSGSARGIKTDEDIIAAEAGHEFSFPLELESVAYVRIKELLAWDMYYGEIAYCASHTAEVTLYGVYDK
jgi:hypothetical protein